MIRAVDTHAHLDHVKNVDEALKQAYEAGVSGVVAVGINLRANIKNLEIKKRTKRPEVFLAFGLHPECLEDYNPREVDEVVEFIKQNAAQAVAVGEIGLDYWYKWAKKDEEKKKIQREVFDRQLQLARELDLPAVIHSRGSWRDCLDMAKGAGVKAAVFHWYSGPLDILEEIIGQGYFISASPALSYSVQHRDAVKHAPVEQTLIETDCPVFYGQGEGGFEATPRDVLKTLKLYAVLKDLPEEKAAEVLYQNAQRIFGLS